MPSEDGSVVLLRLEIVISDLWPCVPVRGTRCDAFYHMFGSQLAEANLLSYLNYRKGLNWCFLSLSEHASVLQQLALICLLQHYHLSVSSSI